MFPWWVVFKSVLPQKSHVLNDFHKHAQLLQRLQPLAKADLDVPGGEASRRVLLQTSVSA